MSPVNVDTPATLKLSIFACPSTSKSPFTSNVTAVDTPAELILPTTSPVTVSYTHLRAHET